ncbi:LysM peptidoglycan-binding domain-containing protein [Cohnella mopanensis]|uniref:LysM peptidoglycan-binding domain-containing protein n=1 Tax=Cohnella mopanensis TaxID=2911966 RepID=UPI001EF9B28B
MTDQLNGLRFDIYERVHLPDDVAAIEELEEIELVPHMQALPQDDQVLLRGNLLLSGVYRSQETAEVNQLEYWIPVEISLPLNRIQSVEQLAVEIDNFDVDLLTSRSLNVTGVLALRGLQVQSTESPIWRDDSFTVVHQAQADGYEQDLPGRYSQTESGNDIEDNPASLFANDYGSEYAAPLVEQEREESFGLQSESESESGSESSSQDVAKESSWLSMFQHLEEPREEAIVPQEPSVDSADAVAQWGDVSSGRLEQPDAALEPELPLASEQILEAEEKPDIRVALGGKALDPAPAQQQQQTGVGLLSQLGEKGAKREAELRIQEAAQAEEKAQLASNSAQSSGDELEWTRLFLNNAQAQSFRKVKMCIVQREETLDLIANRYNVQPRELQLYNRLHEPYLSEGQVLYIP